MINKSKYFLDLFIGEYMPNENMIKKQPFKDTFTIITGGSQGIGKAIAKEITQLGGNVCIIARRLNILKEAVKEIEEVKTNKNQIVEMISCDVIDIDKLKPQIGGFIEKYGIPYYLINCVGQAHPNYIEKLTHKDFKKEMDLNYFGILNPILVILPYMMKKSEGEREKLGLKEWKKHYFGHIINISSEAGFLGIMGYSPYCSSKFAIVGLSECLRNELKPYRMRISVVYPVDTKTPGLEIDEATKPEELKMMTSRAGLMEPDEVAQKVTKNILKRKFNIFIGAAGFHNWAKRHLPWLAFSELDGDLRKARKKIDKYTDY